ncbi:MAG: hypothetical protein JWP35_3595 [Caulobacter sp.]|nr:hypothetical protein [Caulobacter sp.]
MIRTAVAALAAAFALAAPAFASETVHISTAGKSPAQVHAEIVKAASKVCYADTLHEPLFTYVYAACVSQSVSRAVAQLGDSKLSAYHRALATR